MLLVNFSHDTPHPSVDPFKPSLSPRSPRASGQPPPLPAALPASYASPRMYVAV